MPGANSGGIEETARLTRRSITSWVSLKLSELSEPDQRMSSSTPEGERAKSRRYYAANREKVRARQAQARAERATG
jgi:hypothetical protein